MSCDTRDSTASQVRVEVSTTKSKSKTQKQSNPKSKNASSSPASSSSSSSSSTSYSITTLTLTPLGTASAQPSSTRNQSSLAVSLEGRQGGEVWLFDCGEGTQGRVMMSGGDGRNGIKVKMGKISKIFLTHMHGDHVFGLAPLLSTALNGAGGVIEDPEQGILDDRLTNAPNSSLPTIEVYGPLHTRAFLRSALTYTYTHLAGRYVVHELRFAHDPADDESGAAACMLPLHACELPTGRNIIQESDGTWRRVYEDVGVRVDAAPISHSVPCVGYVLTEADVPMAVDAKTMIPLVKKSGAPMSVLGRVQKGEDVVLPDGVVLKGVGKRPGRKIVILGDTNDPASCEAMVELARGADVLVHEATNAYLPNVPLELDGSKVGETAEGVRVRAMSRGHSTPEMAGSFARRIDAKMLVLNHFSARYACPVGDGDGDGDGDEADEKMCGGRDKEYEARRVMSAIKTLAVRSFGSDRVVCARDWESVSVKSVK